MIQWLKAKVVWACLSAAMMIVGAKYLAPDFLDPFLDLANVGLIWIAAKLK